MWMAGMRGAPQRVPKSVPFAIKGILSQITLGKILFAVHINNLPSIVGNRFAVGAQYIKFRECCKFIAILRGKRLQAKITARGYRKCNVLCCVAVCEASFLYRNDRFQIRFLHFPTRRRGIFILVEFIKNRSGYASDSIGRVILQLLEDLDLIAALLEPHSGTIKSLLRPNIPIAAKVVAVDKYDSLAPTTQIKKCIA